MAALSTFVTGFYCTRGVDRRRPGNGTITYITPNDPDNNCTCCGGSNTGIGGICPKGSFCPRGSPAPLKCDPGTYSDIQGAPACWSCPAGYFCLSGAVDFTSNPCPAGHFCPAGTEFGTQNACEAGTYNPSEYGESKDDACLPCPAGEYCAASGMNQTSGNCSEGFYCIINSTTATPVDSPMGSNCPPGFYCPEGQLY